MRCLVIKEGDKRKSILTGKVYRVKTLKDLSAVLESLDGSSLVITEQDNLKLFYEDIEDEEPLKDRVLFPVQKVDMSRNI
jgi:hypothetical protein